MRRSVFVFFALVVAAAAQATQGDKDRLVVQDAQGTLTISAVATDVLRINFARTGVHPHPTDMLDPKGVLRRRSVGWVHDGMLLTPRVSVGVDDRFVKLYLHETIPHIVIDSQQLIDGRLALYYQNSVNIYGERGTEINYRPRDNRGNPGQGIQRNNGATVKAGGQGDGGAPLAYCTDWGVLADSVDGVFTLFPYPGVEGARGWVAQPHQALTFSKGSRKDIEAYIILGPPKRTIQVVADLTGHAPMPPKWSLGFMNSQWKTDEATVTNIVDEYRLRKIPLDAFIFDFDFKAWGEDNYGEWRWNSTNGPGNVGPMKYPDGASGRFAAQMSAKGVKLAGIMKPRILIQNVDGSTMKAAAEATAHKWWMPGKKPYTDYFSHRLANDLDFSNPQCRLWYWQHAKGLFDAGIVAWWNDEADDGFDSLGFFHMQESLYEGQRSASNTRVWSINRNFYLGAQRFGFGTWSGDIGTGFDTMANQRNRMLTMIDLGQPHWTMDTGGFGGHPDPENYARWMEFASVVPIMRVHSTYGERRQPWVYGPIAEAAAKKAIEWRYSMLPSLYSWEHEAHETGAGIVRPLFWEFPQDPACANLENEWMLGDQLLVAPVMHKGLHQDGVYLPPGLWFEYGTDRPIIGGKNIDVPIDSTTWHDLPMYVRAGSILATQGPSQYVGDHTITEITLEVWPSAGRHTKFTVYDDDGETYNYERGDYFQQTVESPPLSTGAWLAFNRPTGRYKTSIKTYRIRLHGVNALSATFAGKHVSDLRNEGPNTTVSIPAGQKGELMLTVQSS